MYKHQRITVGCQRILALFFRQLYLSCCWKNVCWNEPSGNSANALCLQSWANCMIMSESVSFSFSPLHLMISAHLFLHSVSLELRTETFLCKPLLLRARSCNLESRSGELRELFVCFDFAMSTLLTQCFCRRCLISKRFRKQEQALHRTPSRIINSHLFDLTVTGTLEWSINVTASSCRLKKPVSTVSQIAEQQMRDDSRASMNCILDTLTHKLGIIPQILWLRCSSLPKTETWTL